MEADPLALLLFAVKLGLYASTLLAAGLGLHTSLRIVEAADCRRALQWATGLGGLAIIFAALRLAIANVQLGGAFSSIFDLATLAWTWPVLGPSSTAFAAGGVILLVALLLRTASVAGAGAVALAAGFALTGHSQASDPPGLAPWAVGLHVLIAAFWVTAPMTLWPHAALANQALLARTERFSRIALILIPILFLIGVWLAVRLADGVNNLVFSLYGQLLLAKLAVATIALALGAYNKQVVTRQLREAPQRGRRALSLTLGFDSLIFLSALILVGAATSFTGPPAN